MVESIIVSQILGTDAWQESSGWLFCSVLFFCSVFVLWDSCLVAGACGEEWIYMSLCSFSFFPLFRSSRCSFSVRYLFFFFSFPSLN